MLCRVENLEVVYGDVIHAVRGISLEIPDRGCVALLGANGAGKTSTLRAMTGILGFYNGAVTGGRIEFMGEDITHASTEQIIQMGLALVPEGRMVFPHLTPYDNLLVGASTRKGGDIDKDIRRIFEYFPQLYQRRHHQAGYLSGGEQQMLAIGRALMARPKLLVVDELSLGLAPILVQDLVKQLMLISREENMALLLVEQNANLALSVVDYGYICENGIISLAGPSDELLENTQVIESYLGGSNRSLQNFSRKQRSRKRRHWLS